MTQDQVSALSTMPHKLSRDIYLSNDIGRSSPFDPFKKKDMTLMFGGKKDRSTQLMYFAEKPLRKAQMVTPFGNRDFGPNQPNPRKFSIYREISQVSYNPKYTQQDREKSVGFTKARRFQSADYRQEHLENRKHAILTRRKHGDPPHPLIEGIKEEEEKKVVPPPPKSIVVRPDSSKAPSLGKQAGRGWDSLRPKTVDRATRYTKFPWETHLEKSGAEGEKGESGGLEGGGGDTTGPLGDQMNQQGGRPNTAFDGASTTGASEYSGGDGRAKSSNPGPRTGATEEEEEENWLKERKNLLVRFGLNGGGGRRERLRRKTKPKGADFGSTTGREAPVFNVAHGWECNDLLYVPKYAVTGRERKKLADVKLEKYSTRKSQEVPAHVATVNRVLTISNLTKFHEAKLKQDAEGSLAVPSTAPPPSVTKKPLSGADDFATHPQSLRAPRSVVTRVWKGAPDLNLYCDRPDEPLDAVCGESRRKAERRFRKEDRERELAAQASQSNTM